MGLVQTKNRSYLQCNLKGIKEKTDLPVFYEYKTGEYSSKFDGNVVDVLYYPESEKNKYEKVVIVFEDDLGEYHISFSFSMITVGLLNSLYSLYKEGKDFKNIHLSLYIKKDYPRLGVYKDGQYLSWNFKSDYILSKTKKVKLNGKEVTDKTELIEEVKKWIEELHTYLEGQDPFDSVEKQLSDIEVEVSSDDNLPF